MRIKQNIWEKSGKFAFRYNFAWKTCVRKRITVVKLVDIARKVQRLHRQIYRYSLAKR